jgi:hypothetical protein
MLTTTRSSRRLAAALLAVAWLAAPSRGQAQTCGIDNVLADWSETSNPSGPWSYRAGTELLPHVDALEPQMGSWTYPQPAWAEVGEGNGRIPTFLRSNGTETFVRDYEKCDLVVHTQDDASGTGNGQATLTWTATADGIVSIDGAVWQARDIGRSNNWSLLKNDVVLTGGSLASGDIYSRSSPFFFRDGSGGAEAITDIEVEAGDTLNLLLVRTSQAGDFVGVRMRVLCGSLPETTTTTSTLPLYPECGDAVEDQDVKSSDALFVLRTAVGQISCDECVCDTNGNGSTTAGDALAVLRVAVGQPVALDCVPCPCS